MSNDKLVLKDSTEITLEASQGIGALHVLAAGKQAACTLWGKFTKDNLSQVIFQNSSGLTVGNYSDLVLDHVEGREKEDGTVKMTFCLREKSPEEILGERVTSLEAGYQVHTGAIDDIAQAVSDIMEGGAQ